MAILVGTASWADPGFVEEWYPDGLPARDRLPYYAERFDGVEVNSTFYAVPAARTVQRWVDATPDGFVFDVKAHRLLSRHSAACNSLPPDLREQARTTPRARVKLTQELEDALAARMVEAVEPLVAAERFGAFLLQLSPGFAPQEHSLDELAPLLDRLAPLPVAIEFRHRSWASPKRVDDTLAWLEAHGAAWVSVDAPEGKSITIMPPLDAVTRPDLAYLRAHGRNAEGYVRGRSVAARFAYRYPDAELEEIADRARALEERAERVHVMFNNNRGSDAPVAAERMRELLGQVPAPAV
jgi:uncharacterized protein YecE (DUF72 family)